MQIDQVKASYRRLLGQFEQVSVRRYSGAPGARTSEDYDCLARVTAFDDELLAGTLVEGRSRVIVFVDDLVDAGIELPLSTGSDRVVIEGREKSILSIDAATARVGSQTVAFILKVKGGVTAGRDVYTPSLDFSDARNGGDIVLFEDI